MSEHTKTAGINAVVARHTIATFPAQSAEESLRTFVLWC